MRVLITVSGGVASYEAGDDVEVAIFDWDNYLDASTEDQRDLALPPGWKDLAEEAGVPYRNDELPSLLTNTQGE